MAGRSESRAPEANCSGNFHASNNVFAGNQFSTRTGNYIFNSRAEPVALAPSPSIHIPFRRDRDFIERDVLAQVLEKCTGGARVALVGLGGVGKSQIAIEACYRIHKERRDTWIFWVHASSADRFKDGYEEIAARMHIPGRSDSSTNILLTVSRWLSNPDNGKWIMVVDNADDEEIMLDSSGPTEDGQERNALKDYLPISDRGTILLTTRTKRVATNVAEYDEDVLDLGQMTEHEALALLRGKLGPKVAASPSDAVQLAGQLDYMPLALSQAAAYIKLRTPMITVANYVQKLLEDPEEQLRLLCLAMRDPRRDNKATNAILLTWHVSFRYIHVSHPAAGTLLGLMSLFSREHIPQDTLGTSYAAMDQCKVERLEDSIALLRSFDLIGFTDDNISFRMHRLVQLSTRHWLRGQGLIGPAVHAVVQSLDSSFPRLQLFQRSTHQELQSSRQLLPHVEEIIALAPNAEYFCEYGDVFHRAADFYALAGRIDKFVEVKRAIWQAYVQEKGKFAKVTLQKASGLCGSLCAIGKYTEAQGMLREVYSQGAKISCQREPWYWKAAAQLGKALARNGENLEAIRFLDSILPIKDSMNHNEALLEIMEAYANAYENQGQQERAILEYTKIVKLSLEYYGVNHTKTWISYLSLGNALLRAGRLVEAESVLRETNQRQNMTVHTGHLEACIKDALARVLMKQGQLEESIKLYDEIATLSTTFWDPTSAVAVEVRSRASEAREKLSRLQTRSAPAQHSLDDSHP